MTTPCRGVTNWATSAARSSSTPKNSSRATLHVHIAADTLQQLANGEEPTGVLRVEGIGPALATQLKELLGETRLRVIPVIDPAGMPAFDSYEIPDRMREAVTHRNPIEVFPG